MNYIIVFICTLIIPIFSLEKSTTNLCINCKFFKNDLIFSIMNENKYGKCLAFPIEKDDNDFLVTGIKKIEYNFCTIARTYEDMCGKEGKMYEMKTKDSLH